MISVHLEWWQTAGLIIDYSIRILAIGIVPEGRRPAASTAWLLIILVLPIVGLPLFLLMGSAYINRRRHRLQQEANQSIEAVQSEAPDYPQHTTLSSELESIVKLNRRLTNIPAVTGTTKGLLPDYYNSLRRMAEAIDNASEYVHIEIYIIAWDDTTDPFFRACERAVQRGVKVRLLFDHVGSWKYPGYMRLGKRLDSIGVEWHVMLPLRPWFGRWRRPDLRNHRKMVIVDSEVAFMGSQNLIDTSYLLDANIEADRHWIDLMVELEGPVVNSLRAVFAMDWYFETGEALNVLEEKPSPELPEEPDSDINILQLVPSGPGIPTSPNLRLFNSIAHHAKQRLILCSPYFIPDESLFESITSACYRGVQVDLLVSERADNFIVHHAQSSYYQALLEAGVNIHTYPKPYVLHSKFMVADPASSDRDAIGVMGSSNMDMRSFNLNYEISLMVARGSLTTRLSELADSYIASSSQIELEEWSTRGFWRKYLDNACKLTSGLA
ncbi:cardiolipin synthase [Corynebacterium sp. TAE3-ERU2]|uniref:cardiolipin synthase n=1 Tax=Corynebacterium sp. TAE3-ERU2 TaxID=2849497 RepID=UPI001C45D197|nr:cardiolipin synthase [Corynebacterium sp. TAE3-ERU2]